MEAFRRLALAAGLLYFIAVSGFALAVDSVNEQQAVAAPATEKDLPHSQSTPPIAKEKDAPKLKPEAELALRKLREKILGDKIQIDQIAQQAQQQIAQRQQEMQALSRQLAEATEKAVAESGVDKSKWDLNQDLVFVPKAKPPEAKKPEPPKK